MLIQSSAFDFYAASERFPRYLLGPNGASYDVTKTPLNEALGTDKPYWDWLAVKIKPEDIGKGSGVGYSGVPDPKSWSHLKPDADGLIKRPELENFGLGMVGGGKVSGSALPFGECTYAPIHTWLVQLTQTRLSLGQAPHWRYRCGRRRWCWYVVHHSTAVRLANHRTVTGGFILQLLQSFPHFKCIVQDRPEVIAQAKDGFWPSQGAQYLRTRAVTLQSHDFFTPNPIKGAAIYWLRGIM